MINKSKVKIYHKEKLVKECKDEFTATIWLLMHGFIFSGRGLNFISPEIKIIRDFNATWESFEENAWQKQNNDI